MRALRSLLSFGVVGAIGFFVDATVLYLSMGYLGPFYGRCASLVCSMTTTWLINRNITFADSRRHHTKWVEGAVYMAIMLVGASINFLIYAWLVLSNELAQSYPIIGIAVGSGIALVWNFSVARAILYGRRG